ncbi:MAG: TonB-dependent receptor [Balneolaceae bacterium]
MKLKAALLSLVSLFFALSAAAQHSISGKVTDLDHGHTLVAATVQLVELNRATVTNRQGEFQFRNLPDGSFTLRVSYVGHETVEQSVDLPRQSGATFEIALDERPFQADDIVVTASPTDSPIQYRPAQALNSEELQRRSAASFGELLDGEPGVSMRYFGSATARPVIRGFDGDRILVLQNGERMGDLAETSADHGTALDPLNARRVEIVRGPATLLYGTNALGGVVNIFTDDIPRSWAAGLSGQTALQTITSNASGAGSANLTYGEDNWAARGHFSYREGGDIRTPDRRIPSTDTENLSAGGGFGFKGNGFQGGVSYSYNDQTFGIPEELDDPDEEIEVQSNRHNVQGFLEWNTNRFFRNIEWRVSATRFSQQELEFEFEDGVLDEIELGLDFLQYNVSSTLTLKNRPFAFFDEGAFGINTNLRFLELGGEEAFTPDGRSQFVALFTFQEVPLSEVLRLQTGIRLEYQNIEERPNELFPQASLSNDKVTFSGSLGINYRPMPALELGGQFALAQRQPSFEELFANGPHVALGTFDIGNPALDNEQSLGTDAFIRFDNGRLALSASGFYNRVNDFIFRQPTGAVDPGSGFPVVVLTQQDADLYGAELQASYLITPRLQAKGALDYVRGSRVNGNSEPLPFMPPLKTRLGLTYNTHNWWAGGTLQLVDRQDRVAIGEEETGAYELVGLEAGLRFTASGRHILSTRIDNLFNVTYRDHLSRIEDRDFPMPARSFTATYRWIF